MGTPFRMTHGTSRLRTSQFSHHPIRAVNRLKTTENEELIPITLSDTGALCFAATTPPPYIRKMRLSLCRRI